MREQPASTALEPQAPSTKCLDSTSISAGDLVGAINERCSQVAQRYALTARETQVLALLAQGRSRPSIQAKLVLSEGTVKTHITHIFNKTCASSTQELLDLIYEDEPASAEQGIAAPR